MNIALIGVGLMGRPMAERLMDAGYRLFLFNRTKKKAIPLAEKGAVIADSAFVAIASAECVILMLSDYQAICETVFAQADPDFSDKTVIHMGTILPAQSLELKERIEKNHGSYFEAPVLGSRDKAATGSLIVMAGSSPEQFQEFCSLLKCFGADPKYVGTVGKAAALKLALNQLIISLISAFGFSLGMVERAGVKTEDFMEILRRSALFAPTFDQKLPRMSHRNFDDPNFPIKHMLKDVNLILDQAKIQGLETGILQQIEKLLARAIDEGLGNKDYSAIAKVINP